MGSYEWSGRTLHFKQVATTMMACVGEVANQERDFLAALGATESYRIHNATLTLLDKKGKPLARLEARDESTPTQPQ
jgi:putative lipoprotein